MPRNPDDKDARELMERVAMALGMEPTEVIYLPLDSDEEDPTLPKPTHEGSLKKH